MGAGYFLAPNLSKGGKEMKGVWEYGQNDLGAFIKCSLCGHKIDALDVLFADRKLNPCPFCGKQVDISDETIEKIKEWQANQ